LAFDNFFILRIGGNWWDGLGKGFEFRSLRVEEFGSFGSGLGARIEDGGWKMAEGGLAFVRPQRDKV
jgi:hypothetical protein